MIICILRQLFWICLPPAHHHRVPQGVGRDGAKADRLGQLIVFSFSGKLHQSNVIFISPFPGIVPVYHKVLFIAFEYLDFRKGGWVIEVGAEVKHPQSHPELGQILLLAMGSCDKESWGDDDSRADPGVNILDT